MKNMLSKNSLLAFTLFLFTTILCAQSDEFNKLVANVSSQLKSVENSKSTTAQSITSNDLGVVKIVSTETSNKGKVKETSYEFNFADIDKNTIKPITAKDLIKIRLIAHRNQKMIKVVVDGEKTSYVSEIELLASDIDNARALAKEFKTIVPVSQNIIKQRLSFSGYEDRLKWLTKNITNVEVGEKSIDQEFKENNAKGNVTYTTVSANSKSAKTNKYEFNLSNINPKLINFKANGNKFLLKLGTDRSLKTVKNYVNDVPKSYINNFEIVCKSVENARDIQRILKEIIPLAKEKFNSSLPKINSVAEGIQYINSKIEKVKSDKSTITQLFVDDCITKFTSTETSAKKTDEQVYELNLIDINKRGVDIEIKGSSIYVTLLTTNKKKVVKYIKNNQLQNYTNKLSFICKNVDEATVCKKVLEKVISLCIKQQKELANFATNDEGVQLLKDNIKNNTLGKTSYEQYIEKIEEEGKLGLKFTSVKITDKKSVESVSEFNLSDINSKSVKTAVSGKNVKVEFFTNHQQKIIKNYVDGEIKNYTNSVSIMCDSVENARVIEAILKRLTKK